MLSTERVVLHFFILIFFSINGLHSYPRHHLSLGILNKLIGQGQNSPLIVMVKSNNQDRTLNDEQDLEPEQRKGRHFYNPGHLAARFPEREYNNALYELLRKSEKVPEKQHTRSSQKRENGNICRKGNDKKKSSRGILTSNLFVKWLYCSIRNLKVCEIW